MKMNITMDQVEVWKSTRRLAIYKLYKLAKALDEVENDVHKAKIAGAATSIVFGIGSAAAGIVSIFTLGAAVPVSIAFAVIAGGGGVTTAGSTIVKIIIEKTKLKDVQKILDKDIELTKSLKTTFEKVIMAGDITLSVASKVNAALNVAAVIGKQVTRVVGTVGDDAVVAASRSLATLGRVASIAGPVIGLLIVPFDVYTLVTSAIAVDKKKPSSVAEDIRKRAREMQKELNAIEERERRLKKRKETIARGREVFFLTATPSKDNI